MVGFGWVAILTFAVSFFSFSEVGRFLNLVGRGLDGPGIFLLALIDSTFLPIPEGNDLLIVGLSIGKSWTRVAYYVGLSVAGSVLGCLFLYAIARRGGIALVRKRVPPGKMERIQDLYRRYGMVTLMIASLLPPPCPFKVFVLSAGIFGLPAYRFLIAVGLGRLIRYSIWGVLAFSYGPAVKTYMQAHLQATGILLSGVIVVAAIAALAVFGFRRRLQRTRDSVPGYTVPSASKTITTT